jgi:hypothetical protein
MKNRDFKLEKISLETLINLFIELYESGVDYVDLATDNSDPRQDKLVIFTKEGYINPDYYNEDRLAKFDIERDDEDDDEEEPPKNPIVIETRRLSDDDIEELL